MISVIIPIYNAERFLKKCIESLLTQDFCDFELLLVNDGSTDTSGEICNKYAAENDHIRVFHRENHGVAAARNFGLDRIMGDYVTFIDADDFVPVGYLSALYRCIGDADVSVCDVAFYENGKEKRRFSCSEEAMSGYDAVNKLLCRREINSGPYAKLFRSSLLQGLSFPALRIYEDILFVLDAFDKASSVAFTDRTEYAYISNGNSAMNTINAEKCMDVVTASERICEYIRAKGGVLSGEAFYTTVSHLMQYFIPTPKNEAEKALDRAIIGVFAKYRKEIKKCKAFPFKERLIYLSASHNIKIKNGFGKLV